MAVKKSGLGRGLDALFPESLFLQNQEQRIQKKKQQFIL